MGLSCKNPGQDKGWNTRLCFVRSSKQGKKGRPRDCYSHSSPNVSGGVDAVLATAGTIGAPRLFRFLAFLCCLADGEGSLWLPSGSSLCISKPGGSSASVLGWAWWLSPGRPEETAFSFWLLCLEPREQPCLPTALGLHSWSFPGQ
jgi:hypothetical protein